MRHACLVFPWTDLQKLFLRNHFIFFFQSTMIRKRYSTLPFFMLFESNSLKKIQGSFIFNNHGLCHPCYSLTIWLKIFRVFCFGASCRSDRVLSMLFNAVYTAASIEKFVNSSIDPETNYCAQFGANFLIAATVTAGSLQNGLMQDPYFERKMAEFSGPVEINNDNETKYDEIRKNTSHVVLIHLASKERNSIHGFSLISGFY